MPPMRRLARFTLNLLAALSLLLCVAACVLWVRSGTASDYVSLTLPGGRLCEASTWKSEETRWLWVSTVGDWPAYEPPLLVSLPHDGPPEDRLPEYFTSDYVDDYG